MYKPLFEQTNPRTNLDKIIRIRDFDSGRLTKFEFFPKVLCARYVIFAIFLVFCIWVSASGVGLGGKSLKHTCSGKQLSTEEPTFEARNGTGLSNGTVLDMVNSTINVFAPKARRNSTSAKPIYEPGTLVNPWNYNISVISKMEHSGAASLKNLISSQELHPNISLNSHENKFALPLQPVRLDDVTLDYLEDDWRFGAADLPKQTVDIVQNSVYVYESESYGAYLYRLYFPGYPVTPEKTQIKKAPHKRPTGKRRRKASKTSTTFAQPKAPVPHTAVANPSASASFSARESGRTVLNDHGSFPTILPLTEKNYFAEIMDKNNGSTHGSVVIRNSGHLVSATESTTTVEKGRSRRASKHDEWDNQAEKYQTGNPNQAVVSNGNQSMDDSNSRHNTIVKKVIKSRYNKSMQPKRPVKLARLNKPTKKIGSASLISVYTTTIKPNKTTTAAAEWYDEMASWFDLASATIAKKRVHRTRRAAASDRSDTGKSVETLESIRKEAELKDRAAKDVEKSAAHLKQVEKDQALMQEMFDDINERGNEKNTVDLEKNEQLDDDYNEREDRWHSSRDEPYQNGNFADNSLDSEQQAFSPLFDARELTRKHHDNKKAQWPDQLVERIKNAADGDGGIQMDYGAPDFPVAYGREGTNEQETAFDDNNAEFGTDLDENGAEPLGTWSEDSDWDDTQMDVDQEIAEDDAVLDVATEDEKDEMQYMDNSKSGNPRSRSRAFSSEMDTDGTADNKEFVLVKSKNNKVGNAEKVAAELAKLFDEPKKIADRMKSKKSESEIPQEDVNFLKEIVLGPFLPPGMALNEKRLPKTVGFPKESDVKPLPIRADTRPFQFRASTRTGSDSPPDASVRNVLTLNINVGPNARLRLNQGNADSDYEDDLPDTGADKNIKINFMRTGKARKDVVADLTNSKPDSSRKSRNQNSGVKPGKAAKDDDTDDDDDDDGENDDETRENKKRDKTPVIRMDSDKIPAVSSQGMPRWSRKQRRRRKSADTMEFDISMNGNGDPTAFDPALDKQIVAIKLGSITGNDYRKINRKNK